MPLKMKMKKLAIFVPASGAAAYKIMGGAAPDLSSDEAGVPFLKRSAGRRRGNNLFKLPRATQQSKMMLGDVDVDPCSDPVVAAQINSDFLQKQAEGQGEAEDNDEKKKKKKSSSEGMSASSLPCAVSDDWGEEEKEKEEEKEEGLDGSGKNTTADSGDRQVVEGGEGGVGDKMLPVFEPAENHRLRQDGESAAFYVGGEGHLAAVVKNTGGAYVVDRTWVLPREYARQKIQWMTRFRTVDDEGRVAVFTEGGRSMLVFNPRDMREVEDGGDLQIEDEVNLQPAGDETGLTNPVGARASPASGYQKLYVAMFQQEAGVVTVANYSVKDKNAKVHQYPLSSFLHQLDDSAKNRHHLHNAHTFPADMCGGHRGAEVTLVNDLGEVWQPKKDDEEARGYGVLQFVEEGYPCEADHDQTCFFRNATQVEDVPQKPSVMANQMHARQTARDLTTPEMLFVAEQPPRSEFRNLTSRLHWVEVQKAKKNGSCRLIVKQTEQLPYRGKGKKDYGEGVADVIPLPSHHDTPTVSRVLISDRWADEQNGKVYLYEISKNDGEVQKFRRVGRWEVGKNPRHTALLADRKTLVSANFASSDVSVNYIDSQPDAGDAKPADVVALSFKPLFVLE
eukprot:g11997.t1